ncbi:MAG: hypothetical protein LDLANPLL_01486 [Turneriella sp.]|nr:hypothetical protein [Turneriella sp.]
MLLADPTLKIESIDKDVAPVVDVDVTVEKIKALQDAHKKLDTL